MVSPGSFAANKQLMDTPKPRLFVDKCHQGFLEGLIKVWECLPQTKICITNRERGITEMV